MARTIEEVNTPRDCEVRSAQHALSVIEDEYDFPVVVKQDLSGGGVGVWVCDNQKEVVSAFAELRQNESDESLLHWLWKMYNLTPFMRDFDKRGNVSVQEFIDGDPYLHSFVALNGRVLGGNTVRRELPYKGANSPHCRYRAVEDNQMREAAKAIVEETGFSGFGCFDFMVDKKKEIPYLIECNPFPTNVAHIGNILGDSLCVSLREGLFGAKSETSNHKTEIKNSENVAVLFPYEILRDAHSKQILSRPHDVPIDDPKLLEAMKDMFGISDSSIKHLGDSNTQGGTD
jgi:predicted ATP-grasp superfamily ATP-dependent carboligase